MNNKSQHSMPIALRNIKITDGFWKKKMELIRTEVIPYQWQALNNNVPDAEPSFCMHNFELAGQINRTKKVFPIHMVEFPKENGIEVEKFYGWIFQDSDFAKWIEAVGYSLSQHPDPTLEETADAAIEIVCAAQLDNGYLDTAFIINDLSKAFTNLRDYHELYCFGHLVEGAVAYYIGTGKHRLLKAAEKYADYIESLFGVDPEKCKGYPGHEIAEMALIRLYEVTENEKYLRLSEFFILERGKSPLYFDIEHQEVGKYEYQQAHKPVLEQEEAVGHAVRGVYLYSGLADIARIRENRTYFETSQKLWDNIVHQKMYITGGIGGTHVGESFSYNYDLPNDTAYAETCASIGLVFFARRLLQIQPKASIANVMERALYNGILSGIALDGKSFFYVNPLEVYPEACYKDERIAHVKPIRQKWFGCACCPPNISRMISSIGLYAYTEAEDTVYTHLYVNSEIKKKVAESNVRISVKSGFPWNGRIEVKFETSVEVDMTLAFRKPDWCGSFDLSKLLQTYFNDDGTVIYEKEGYVYVIRTWKNQDQMNWEFPMDIRLIKANNKVRENVGKIAVTRGPLVYCIEEADNGNDLYLLKMLEAYSAYTMKIQHESILGIKAKGLKEQVDKSELYIEVTGEELREQEITLIPYYTWANRGEGEMQVWINKA